MAKTALVTEGQYAAAESRVPKGYRQTEVGVIPEDWEVKPLGGIAPIATGNTPPTRDPKNYGDEFLFVSPADLGYSKYISRTEKMLSKKGFSISRPFPVGSVLFVCIGSTIGKCGIASEKLTTNQQINAILASERLSSDYLYYAVLAVAAKVKSLAGEQAVPIVNKTQFSETAIAFPPTKAEQEAIAEALSDADSLVEGLEQLIAKKRHLKQGAMQELLSRKRGWIEKKLGNTALIKARIGWHGLTTAEYLESGDFYLVTGTDFDHGYVEWSSCYHVEEWRYNQDPYIQLKDSDVIMTKDGTIGKVAFVERLHKPSTLNSGLFVIRPKDSSFYPKFLYYLLCSNVFEEFLRQLSAGSTINHLYQKDFVNFIYATPPTNDEQAAIAAIAAILSDMDAVIAALEAKLTKARAIKQGMMQELLTGRVRLI